MNVGAELSTEVLDQGVFKFTSKSDLVTLIMREDKLKVEFEKTGTWEGVGAWLNYFYRIKTLPVHQLRARE